MYMIIRYTNATKYKSRNVDNFWYFIRINLDISLDQALQQLWIIYQLHCIGGSKRANNWMETLSQTVVLVRMKEYMWYLYYVLYNLNLNILLIEKVLSINLYLDWKSIETPSLPNAKKNVKNSMDPKRKMTRIIKKKRSVWIMRNVSTYI